MRNIQQNNLLSNLINASKAIKTPKNFFSGLTLSNGFVPDNIVLFHRTNRSELIPEGISHNFHHRYELLVVLENGGPLRIGSHQFNLEPGQSALIFPNQFHYYYEVKSELLDWIFITFELSNGELVNLLHNSPRILNASGALELKSLIELFAKNNNSKDLTDPLTASFHLAHLLKSLITSEIIPEENSFYVK